MTQGMWLLLILAVGVTFVGALALYLDHRDQDRKRKGTH
jgi:hypothetical protein